MQGSQELWKVKAVNVKLNRVLLLTVKNEVVVMLVNWFFLTTINVQLYHLEERALCTLMLQLRK